MTPIARAILEQRGATWVGERGDRRALLELLHDCGYEPHEPALLFEERYGGLQLQEGGESSPALVVGTYSCLLSGFSRYPRGGSENAAQHLIPVMLGWDDMIYYLGSDGRGWLEWADGIRMIARDASQLLTRALLWRVMLSSGDAVFESGHHGGARARELGLPPIDDAFGGEQWWGTPNAVVVRFDHPTMGPCTYFTAADTKRTD